MSIGNLRAASVMAVFLACIPAPTLAQSLDLGFHYNLSTEFRGAQNAPGPLNGGTNLFVERVTEHVKLKPWAVQLSAGFARTCACGLCSDRDPLCRAFGRQR